VDPQDLCLLDESGWRAIDPEHVDFLLNQCLQGQYRKNVLSTPQVHVNHKGSDGRQLMLGGKHIVTAVLKAKDIHMKIEAGDAEVSKEYDWVEWTPKLVVIVCSSFYHLRISLVSFWHHPGIQ
jgi:hypothetical protein